eukprot:TRINITY_DN91328_c0_g1_i1.p1 TRINITY_DN91328_c0_g1~~TRINITY_DN91328_c0_g1_i1.p1  ORF type:complete len:1512 (+),score=382.45 TRINITY_DN91328_c0_g1_i1:207-4742(+)
MSAAQPEADEVGKPLVGDVRINVPVDGNQRKSAIHSCLEPEFSDSIILPAGKKPPPKKGSEAAGEKKKSAKGVVFRPTAHREPEQGLMCGVATLEREVAHELGKDGQAIDIPDALPLHFCFDVQCVWLGAEQGKYSTGKFGLNTLRQFITKEWRRCRALQERAWQAAGKLPHQVEHALGIYGKDLAPADEDVDEAEKSIQHRLRDWIKNKEVMIHRHERWKEKKHHIIKIERIGCPSRGSNGFTSLTAKHLQQATACLHLEMIVNLEHDPLLKEVGYLDSGGTTKFIVPIYLYENYLPPTTEKTEPTRVLRAARIPSFEYAILMPAKPYADCKLDAPVIKDSIRRKLPDDRFDTLNEDSNLDEVLLQARATLAWLFWYCFDRTFPEIVGKTPYDVVETLGPVERMKLHRKHLVDRNELMYSRTREQALKTLWSCTVPKPFQIPFRRRVFKGDVEDAGLLAHIEHAMQAVAREVDEADLSPAIWSRFERGPTWPLEARMPDGCKTEEDFKKNHIEETTSFIEGDMKLALVQFKAVLSGSLANAEAADAQDAGDDAEEEYSDDDLPKRSGTVSQSSLGAVSQCSGKELEKSGEAARLAASKVDVEEDLREEKLVNVCVDLTDWETEGHLDVMDINCNDHVEVQGMLRFVKMLEACVELYDDELLTKRVSQLAYGLHHVQAALIKQQLRSVGLTVVETNRVVSKGEDGFLKVASVGVLVKEQLEDALDTTMDVVEMVKRGSLTMEMDEGDEKKPTQLAQRVLLVSAPEGVLRHNAQGRGWIATICPSVKTGLYPGGFRPEQFMRDGPMTKFWVETEEDPYPYRPYFLAASQSSDPLSIFTSAERKFIVRSFITDPISEIRYPDGSIDPRQGGANLDPNELKTGNIIEDFIPLYDTLSVEQLLHEIMSPRYELVIPLPGSRKICADVNMDLCAHVGPQIASYYEFVAFYKMMLIALTPLSIFCFYAGQPGTFTSKWSFWGYIRPAFGLFISFWGALFCSTWRRRAASLGLAWQNGVLELGMELQAAGGATQTQRRVRPEFALKFRKHFEEAGLDGQQHITNKLRRLLWVDQVKNSRLAGPDVKAEFERNFNNRLLKQDIERFNEVGYNGFWERLLPGLVSYLVTALLILLATCATFFSMWFSEAAQDEESGLGERAMRLNLGYVISGFVSGCVVPGLNYLNKVASLWTTEMQNFRHDSEYQATLFVKLFAFQLFNRFNSLLWIAFWRQNMEQLQIQVLMLLFMPSVSLSISDVIVPVGLYWRAVKQQEKTGEVIAVKGTKRSMTTYVTAAHLQGGDLGRSLNQMTQQLLCDQNGQFDVVAELIELVVQFGLVTMFLTACPLAPPVALVTCCINHRSDALKLCRLQRKPETKQAVGIGISYVALQTMCYFALAVNCALLVFSRVDIKDVMIRSNKEIGNVFSSAGENKSGETVLDLVFPYLNGVQKMLVLLVGENSVLLMMILAFQISPMSFSLIEEMYRQQYFDNREAASYDEDEDDQGQVTVMRRRARTKEAMK